MDQELRREILLDNYTNPFHKETKTEGYISANGNNVSCIDNINIYVKMENDVIVDAYFDGEACAISTASTSIMLKEIIGKKIDVVKKFIDNFEAMVDEKDYDESIMKESLAFNEIYKQQSRKTCATLPYKALLKIVNK